MLYFMQSLIIWPGVMSMAISLLVCIAIILLSGRSHRLSGRSGDLSAVQAMHVNPTPRVGGVAVFTSFCLSWFFVPVEISVQYIQFILATSILFFVGLIEDLGYGVSPRKRLFAAWIASFVIILLLDIWIPRIGIPWVDWLMEYPFIGVPLTLFVTAGIVNGFNLIDGVNGLSAMTAIVGGVAMGLIAGQVHDLAITYAIAIFVAAVFGFFVVNFPFGKIFLGDAGAYMLGFVLSWAGIVILNLSPEVSPWAILLAIFWPAADIILAIYRRFLRQSATMAPDRLHMHQLVMRLLEISVLGRNRRHISNPLSTLVLSPFVILPPLTGVLFWDSEALSFISVVIFSVLFFVSYFLSFRFVRRMRLHYR